MNGASLAKGLIAFGLIILVVGVILFIGSKMGISFGKLPGDIMFKGEKTTVYFPIVTMLILSVVLTVILNVIFAFFKK